MTILPALSPSSATRAGSSPQVNRNRCPLCNKPLTKVHPGCVEHLLESVSPELQNLTWAGCFDCKILSSEPFDQWHAFAAEEVDC